MTSWQNNLNCYTTKLKTINAGHQTHHIETSKQLSKAEKPQKKLRLSELNVKRESIRNRLYRKVGRLLNE